MYSRFRSFAGTLRSSSQRSSLAQSAQCPRLAQYICQTCQHKISAFSSLSKITRIRRRNLVTAAKNTKDKKYPSELLIYDAGDTRTTYVAFWKAVGLLQFGTCLVFGTPMLYKNENQPSQTIRTFQAVGVTALAALPSLILSFLTAPFVNQVYLSIPPSATHSLTALRAFARNLPSTTRLRFLTLRVFPIGKMTPTYLFELRALPAGKFRFANIEVAKNDIWRKRQAEKGWGQRMKEFFDEPRYKFFVKEGRAYTVRSGVPGVWEDVAKRIQEQTVKERDVVGAVKGAQRSSRSVTQLQGSKEEAEAVKKQKMVRRQTFRSPMK